MKSQLTDAGCCSVGWYVTRRLSGVSEVEASVAGPADNRTKHRRCMPSVVAGMIARSVRFVSRIRLPQQAAGESTCRRAQTRQVVPPTPACNRPATARCPTTRASLPPRCSPPTPGRSRSSGTRAGRMLAFASMRPNATWGSERCHAAASEWARFPATERTVHSKTRRNKLSRARELRGDAQVVLQACERALQVQQGRCSTQLAERRRGAIYASQTHLRVESFEHPSSCAGVSCSIRSWARALRAC